jgi:hypothetical protein
MVRHKKIKSILEASTAEADFPSNFFSKEHHPSSRNAERCAFMEEIPACR